MRWNLAVVLVTANTSAFQVTDSLTHIRGRHTLKAGGSLILRKRVVYFSDNPVGLFGFARA